MSLVRAWVDGACSPWSLQEWFGALLSLADYTALPATLPDTRYFSYWPSAMALATAAAADAGIAARFRDSATAGAANNGAWRWCACEDTVNDRSCGRVLTLTSLPHAFVCSPRTHAAPRWNQPQQSPRGVETGMLVVGVRSPEVEETLQDLRRRVVAAEGKVLKRRAERAAAAAEAAESGFEVAGSGDEPSEEDEIAEYLAGHSLTLASLGNMDAAPSAVSARPTALCSPARVMRAVLGHLCVSHTRSCA